MHRLWLPALVLLLAACDASSQDPAPASTPTQPPSRVYLPSGPTLTHRADGSTWPDFPVPEDQDELRQCAVYEPSANAPITVAAVTLTPAGLFSLADPASCGGGGDCRGFTFTAGASCTVAVLVHRPSGPATQRAALTFSYEAVCSGRGAPPCDSPRITAGPVHVIWTSTEQLTAAVKSR